MNSGFLSKILNGLIWVTGSTVANSALRVVFVGILARILTPADFGLMATGMLIIKFSEVVAQMGVGPALIQKKELSDHHLNAGFTLSLLFGVGLCGFFLLINPVLADFFKMKGLRRILDFLCFAIPVRMIAQVSYSMIQREMMFKKLATVDVISYLGGYGLFGIIFALNGYGVMSLVYAVIIQSALNSILLLFINPHKIKLTLNRVYVNELLSFGVSFTFGTIFNFFARNGDTIVISRYIGSAQLGIYDRAYVLMNVANNVVGKAIGTVMFSAFSQLQNEEENRNDLFIRSMALAFGLLLPVTAFTYIYAEEIVLVLLGNQWLSTVLPFRILCLFLVFRVVYKVCGSFLKGLGFVFAHSIMQFVYMVMIMLGSFLVKERGIEVIAVVVGLSLMLNFLFQLFFIEFKAKGLLKKVGLDFLSSLPLTAVLLVGLKFFRELVYTFNWAPVLAIIAGCVASLGLIVLLRITAGSRVFNPYLIQATNRLKNRK